MSFFEKLDSLLEEPEKAGQLAFQKADHSTGEGDRYEEAVLALVFLRSLRARLRFALSANDAAAGKFDDLVLRWRSRDSAGASAMLVQLKHKTSEKHTKIRRASLMARKNSKKGSKDFSIELYHESYEKIRESLAGGNYTLVLSTNLDLDNDAKDMFVPGESVPDMELLDSGGRLYRLNPDDDYIKCLMPGDDGFIQHFYLFCNQSSNKSIREMIYKELKLTLGADDSCCKRMCGDLCGSVREWMNSQKTFLTSSWSSWLNIVHTYIRDNVTACNSIISKKIKYSKVEPLQAYIQDRNPAWIRPPGRGAAVLTATKLHQILRDEPHIVVSLTQLQEKVQCCWGPFCRWLVLVDDTEESCDILRHMEGLAGPKRRLLIVSQTGDDFFHDTCKSADIPDDTWKELLNVKIELNSEQYLCCLGDLCDMKALKTMLDENPEALPALSQLTGPVRMGQDLDPLPNNHIDRRLISRMHVREEFFSKLRDYDVCIMDKLSYDHLTNVSVNKLKFEELENYLCDQNASWPAFGVTDNFELPVIQMICSKFQNICVYILSYVEDGWEILFLHRGSAKILPYVKEQSRSLWQIVDSLSRRIIVDGKPGIGKSTLLLDIASQVKSKNPSWWILRINLLTYSKVFSSSSSSHEAVNDILFRVVYNEKNLGILEHSLLLHCLKNYPRIICLVDGFDEICPDYAEKCLQALQQLAPCRGKLVVATRPSVTGRLEAAMGVLAHSLPAFTEEQVHRFHQGGKLGVTDVVVELLKIPLFSRMYAEALESGIVVDDIVSLYETFFERKFRRLYEKTWGEDLSKPGMKRIIESQQKTQKKNLGFLAVSHLLPNLEVSCAAQLSSEDIDDLESAGVIYKFIDDKPVFIHRTFAEHFLAKWCFSDIDKARCAVVYQTALSDNSLEFFVESFDRMASRGRPLLTAVLNGSESEVESLLLEEADPAERDEMGRNSLHLAAAYNRDFTESTLLWLLVRRLEMAGAERLGGSASGRAAETREARNEVVVHEMDEKARLADKDRTSQCVQVTSDLGLAEASEAAGLWAVAATDPVSAALGAEDALLQWTPLRYAAERRRWGAVAALLEAGAQLRHLGGFQRGLLHPQELWRVFKEDGYIALTEHIKGKDWRRLEKKVGVSIACAEMSPQQYKEICLEATRRWDWEVARILHLKIVEMQNKPTSSGSPELQLNQGATLKPRHEAGLGISKKLENKRTGSTEERQTAEEDDAEGWTELQRAVAAGDVAGVRRLVEAGAGVDMQDNMGETAMHLAAEAGCVECLKLLLSAGAAVNVKDEDGDTALHAEAREGRRQAVRLLLEAGADAGAQDRLGQTPLHVAAEWGNRECLRLMARAVKTLEVKDEDGYTALHMATRSGDVASVRLLLAAGADRNAVDGGLSTPLHWAVECVRLLLQAGAGVVVKDKRSGTALHWAARIGNADCARLLLEAGADIREKDEDGDTPLHWAARKGRAACIRLLLEEGADVHQRDSRGQTPLHYAAYSGHAECVRLLLQAGADVQKKDDYGDTPLHLAARYGRAACIRLLLQKGADVHQKNREGETPLHCAASSGYAECARQLLDAGADALAQDTRGETPLQVAARCRRQACLTLLNSAVAQRERATT